MFSLSLSKIWQFADNLETDGWIYTVIKDLKLREITDKFTVINECNLFAYFFNIYCLIFL